MTNYAQLVTSGKTGLRKAGSSIQGASDANRTAHITRIGAMKHG